MTVEMLAFSTDQSNLGGHLGILLCFAHNNRIVTSEATERIIVKNLSHIISLYALNRKIVVGVRRGGQIKYETLDPDYVAQPSDVIIYIDML